MKLKVIFKKGAELARFLESLTGDLLLNINSRGRQIEWNGPQGKYKDEVKFDTVAHLAIRKAIEFINANQNDVVIVLGCGKGRALCHFLRLRVRKVIGVDISEKLCEEAMKNAQKVRGRRAPFEIWNVDAAIADLSMGTIFFLFNPFGAQTLRQVLNNIEKNNGCSLRIIYMNAIHHSVFMEFPWLEIAEDYVRAKGQRVVIYRKRKE